MSPAASGTDATRLARTGRNVNHGRIDLEMMNDSLFRVPGHRNDRLRLPDRTRQCVAEQFDVAGFDAVRNIEVREIMHDDSRPA